VLHEFLKYFRNASPSFLEGTANLSYDICPILAFLLERSGYVLTLIITLLRG
jgi:hypothetical protein